MSKVVKEIRISKIDLSYKYEGCCFITSVNGKEYRRKFYPRTTGKLAGRSIVFYEDEAYSFRWVGKQGVDIQWEYSVVPDKDGKKPVAPAPEVPEVKPEVAEPIIIDENEEVHHEKFLQIKTCIENNIPVYLVGPAGSGKNHTLEQIAKDLELEFYFTNSVQQEYKLTGFIDAGGNFHETEFYKAFKNGGLFFLDEMDASIPEVLVLLNAAIANGYFEFPNGKITAHEDFRVVAAGNTVGNGADEQYTGRLVLDQATLDRFAIIEFSYSRKIELHLAKGNIELVEFIHNLREQAKEKGVRATFSYRCITMVRKLEGKLELTDIMIMAIFKGMDKDTINTFRIDGNTKYFQAMKKVQA
jgi:hypothetical protein